MTFSSPLGEAPEGLRGYLNYAGFLYKIPAPSLG